MPTRLWVVAAFLISLAGCKSSKALTREQAKELLSKHEFFKTPKTYPFILSIFSVPGNPTLGLTLTEGNNETKGYRAMESEDYIQIVKNKFGSFVTLLTPKGNDAAKRLNWKIAPVITWPQGVWVAVANPQVVAVTGLKAQSFGKEGPTTANWTEAEFTWKLVLNDMGEMLAKHGVDFTGSGPGPWDFDVNKASPATATIEMYDDGWRVTHMSDAPQRQ